jgi:hypothetical protein
MCPKTSVGLVSIDYFLFIPFIPDDILIHFLLIIADKPELQPLKDYDDYTSFINDTFAEDKNKLMNTVQNLDRKR